MSLIISTGSNIGDSLSYLSEAKNLLLQKLTLSAESRVYTSSAVDFLDQPDFLNQVLQFEIPSELDIIEILEFCQEIENALGRKRIIDKGPRTIDIDILFFDKKRISTDKLQIPHPRLFERSFIVLPLRELPCFCELQQDFEFPETFSNSAKPL